MNKPLKVYGYARLSREDLRGAEATEEKLKARAQMCLDLAKQHGLPLRAEDIVTEMGSGTSLVDREGLCRLLSLARKGELTHLITPYQDRLTRGNDSDRGTIKESLCSGNVVVVTTEGVMAFDRDFGDRHELIFDIKAAVASHYVRDIIKKRKESDLVRLKQGKSHMTAAPYGYRRVAKKDVLEGLYPADQLGTFHVIPEEYVILEEIFRRLLLEKAPDICRDLNVREVPTPSARRPCKKATRWYPGTIYSIIRNPFYVGLLSQRSRVERGRGKVKLKPSEYVLSEVKGEWPCPITDEQHHSFQSRIEGHKKRSAPRTGLLTGLVYCPNGRPMRIAALHMYGCDCKERGENHRGILVSGDRLVPWVQSAINALVDNLPDDALPSAPSVPQDRKALLSSLAACRRELMEKEQQAQDMILRESYFVSLLGRTTFEETARKTRDALETLRARLLELETLAAKPDASESLSLLQRVRRLGGMPRFWETATDTEKRGLVERIVQRIDLELPQKRFYTAARLTYWEWVEGYAPEAPPFPRVMGRVENLRPGKH